MCSLSARVAGQNFLKALSATSARATQAPRRTDRSSDKRQPTPTTAEDFVLGVRSELPDPRFHAYRKDLADIGLAGCVIASHYAEPVDRVVAARAILRSAPSDDAEAIGELEPGEAFSLVEDNLAWSWGYAGEKRRVGYVPSAALRQP